MPEVAQWVRGGVRVCLHVCLTGKLVLLAAV